VGLVFLGLKLYKRDRDVKCDFYTPMNIGGWMILPLIGLFITPFNILRGMIYQQQMFDTGVWSLAMNNESGYDAIFLVMEVIACTALINYCVFLIIMMIRRRTIFPVHYMYYRIGGLVLALLFISRTDLSSADNEGVMSTLIFNLVTTIIGSAIWIPYMFFSYRARSVFVFRYDRSVVYKDAHPSDSEGTTEAPQQTDIEDSPDDPKL
jgi:hypothetical protein